MVNRFIFNLRTFVPLIYIKKQSKWTKQFLLQELHQD